METLLNKNEELIISKWLQINNFEIQVKNYDEEKEKKIINKIFPQNNINDTHINTLREITVAYILLKNIQNRLPNTYFIHRDKTYEAREKIDKSKLGVTKINFIPRRLFCINWADSGPGISWPEDYFITYIPNYNVNILTVSADDELYGGIATDSTIGWVKQNYHIKDLEKIIKNYWQEKIAEVEQEKWANIFDEGIIKKETLNNWREKVWKEEVDEE
jgi:hypothetical protein|tara:strand:- start:88 stop:741 length:654 start_codon:yes stop_codon:yes gene_type:complete